MWTLGSVLAASGRLQRSTLAAWAARRPLPCAAGPSEASSGAPDTAEAPHIAAADDALVGALLGGTAGGPRGLPSWLRSKLAQRTQRLLRAAQHIQRITQGGTRDTGGMVEEHPFACSAWAVAELKLRDYFSDAHAWLTAQVLSGAFSQRDADNATALSASGTFGSALARRLRLAVAAAMRRAAEAPDAAA